MPVRYEDLTFTKRCKYHSLPKLSFVHDTPSTMGARVNGMGLDADETLAVQDLTMRMGMRRFTRLTNAFSKKLQSHLHMLSLSFVHCMFVRIHKTLKMTPAMAAGVSDTLHDMDWIVGPIDAGEPATKKRGQYKKKVSQE